ncbi:VTT domain-containing protein [Liquorilactobacillus uvarum]|uniref:VTT domain-containing protein n=1 Tax=Liquorilactobacillus uvarum TaxID=303240 RepID=UPI000709FA04|nr:VTT domain-containing protein [Liquorilactobacillus uvarum]
MINQALFFLSHFHLYLAPLVETLGGWVYFALFALVFMETGLVVFAFLPGESLIFFTSTLAAITGSTLDIRILIPVFFFAALIGDTVNYEIGRNLHRLSLFRRLIPEEKLEKTQRFFEKHGGKAVIFGRFIPLIRTFIPLISGSARMDYKRFSIYNMLGVLLWVTFGSSLGYFFGQISYVQEHFSLIFIALAALTAVPGLFVLLYRFMKKGTSPGY